MHGTTRHAHSRTLNIVGPDTAPFKARKYSKWRERSQPNMLAIHGTTKDIHSRKNTVNEVECLQLNNICRQYVDHAMFTLAKYVGSTCNWNDTTRSQLNNMVGIYGTTLLVHSWTLPVIYGDMERSTFSQHIISNMTHSQVKKYCWNMARSQLDNTRNNVFSLGCSVYSNVLSLHQFWVLHWKPKIGASSAVQPP